MRTIPTMLIALLVLLAACAPVGTRELHELVLVRPDGATKLRYAYGSADRMVLNGAERRIGDAVGDAAADVPYAVGGARRIDDAPYLATGIDRAFGAPLTVARIPLSSDLRVTTHAPVEEARYFDGARWLALGREWDAGGSRTVVPVPVSGGLRGLGSLTPAEADALGATLTASGGPAIVALLPEGAVRDITGTAALGARPLDGLDEYRHTAVWVQGDLRVDPTAYAAPPDEGVFDVVARGEQGDDPGEDRFVLIRDADELRAFWNAVHGSSFTPPPVPEARFERETLVGVRLAQRPTGGYGIEVAGVERSDGEVYVDVRLVEPGEGAITTQAITTPWVLVRALGIDADVAWFRDAETGELFAVARADEGGP